MKWVSTHSKHQSTRIPKASRLTPRANSPAPKQKPIRVVYHSVEAVVTPNTMLPLCRMAPAPINTMPVRIPKGSLMTSMVTTNGFPAVCRGDTPESGAVLSDTPYGRAQTGRASCSPRLRRSTGDEGHQEAHRNIDHVIPVAFYVKAMILSVGESLAAFIRFSLHFQSDGRRLKSI